MITLLPQSFTWELDGDLYPCEQLNFDDKPHENQTRLFTVNQMREYGADEYKRGTETLKQVTAERDDLSKLVQQALDERDHYLKERDKLADELKSLRDSGVELPDAKHKSAPITIFTKAELINYGDRRAMAERERCAQVCVAQAADADSAKRKPLLTQSGQMLYEGICGGAMNCAEAIRKGE